MIKLESITKSFEEKVILNELSLNVKKNEILALLGPNGCGKTTTLNIISGLSRPNNGRIFINDVLVGGKSNGKTVHLAPYDRKVGYVFQTTALFSNMRLRDNVAYGLKAKHLSKQDAKAKTRSLLDFVGMHEYADYFPHQISGGQKQRIALARSLATDPEVLLLDEPVTALDPQFRESFRLELKNYLQALKMTVMYVTHNLNEAFVMSDTIAIMGNGHIEQIGTRTEIFEKPSSRYVGEFLGINVYDGNVTNRTHLELTEVDINGVKILASPSQNPPNSRILITLKPEDVILTITPSIYPDWNGSNHNSIKGTIIDMVQMRSTTQITVDVGFPIKVRLLSGTQKELGLTTGGTVFAQFKAESVNISANRKQ